MFIGLQLPLVTLLLPPPLLLPVVTLLLPHDRLPTPCALDRTVHGTADPWATPAKAAIDGPLGSHTMAECMALTWLHEALHTCCTAPELVCGTNVLHGIEVQDADPDGLQAGASVRSAPSAMDWVSLKRCMCRPMLACVPLLGACTYVADVPAPGACMGVQMQNGVCAGRCIHT